MCYYFGINELNRIRKRLLLLTYLYLFKKVFEIKQLRLVIIVPEQAFTTFEGYNEITKITNNLI